MVKITILVRTGTESAFHQAGIVAVGAMTVDYPVRIFFMDDAITALKKYKEGKPIPSGYSNAETEIAFNTALEKGKIMSWEELILNSKKMGNVEVVVCALGVDLLEIDLRHLPSFVDKISGAADLVGGIKEGDIVFTF